MGVLKERLWVGKKEVEKKQTHKEWKKEIKIRSEESKIVTRKERSKKETNKYTRREKERKKQTNKQTHKKKMKAANKHNERKTH